MSEFTVCVKYRDQLEPAEFEVIPTQKMVQLVRGFDDTFVESYEVYDSAGEELSEEDVRLIVDSLGIGSVVDSHI